MEQRLTQNVDASDPVVVPRGTRAESSVERALRTAGEPLPEALRSFLEMRFGHDLSHVQVHTDAAAAASAREVGAAAFTVGSHVVFGAGQYEPTTDSGRWLAAHEAFHTLQYQAPPSSPGPVPQIGHPHSASEREADDAANAVRTDGPTPRPAAVRAGIQRQPLPGGPSRLPDPDILVENASPLLASAIGSLTIDGFDTGSSVLKRSQWEELARTAHDIIVLLRQHPLATVEIVGCTDTVGTEARNLALGTARAESVRAALLSLDVPEASMTIHSRGEGAPQAVPTKDERPNARNRRVELTFRAGAAGLTFGVPPLRAPRPDLPLSIVPRLHDAIQAPGPAEQGRPKLPDHFWKPIPPPPRGSGPKSVAEVIAEKVVDPVVRAATRGLPKSVRDTVREKAHDAVERGVPALARTAAEAAGVTDAKALEAIEKATEAAIKKKGQKGSDR